MSKENEVGEFMSQFAHYARYKRQFEKAAKAVLQGCVKKHLFRPSGRILYTVVGSNGDEFVDPEKPFCSCSHFFFRVLGEQDEVCYHLLSYRLASEARRIEQICFQDEEYRPFVRMVALDILANMKDKRDKVN